MAFSRPNDTTRFRSFAERYLVSRSGQFTKGRELEEGWQTIQDAKKLFAMIERADEQEGPRDAAMKMPPQTPPTRAPNDIFWVFGMKLDDAIRMMTEAQVPLAIVQTWVYEVLRGKSTVLDPRTIIEQSGIATGKATRNGPPTITPVTKTQALRRRLFGYQQAGEGGNPQDGES